MRKKLSHEFMRAIIINNDMPKPKLQLIEWAKPVPNKDEVLIKVKASGVNWADIEQKEGNYPPPPGASPIMGLEVSGIVCGIGKNVKKIKIGDKVMALLSGGGYAEYAVAHHKLCLRMPNNIDYVTAAAVPESCFTIWGAVYQLAKLRAKEKILVHGCGSIGSTLIQIANHFKSEVYVTCSSNAKCALARKLGAKKAINYKEQNFVGVIADETQGKGVDVILDIVGGDSYFENNISSLATSGRLIIIDCKYELAESVNMVPIITRNLTIYGSVLRPRSISEKSRMAKHIDQKIVPLLKNRVLKPLVSHVFPLLQAEKAHEFMKKGTHVGKVVLTVDN